MSFVNRLNSILPSMGTPVQNDVLFLSTGNAIATTGSPAIIQVGTQSSPLVPTISKGIVRVKCYQFVTTSATVTDIQVTMTDGTTFVLTGHYNPSTAALLGLSPGGTKLANADGHMTNGSKVLTAADALFTPQMVGAPVSVSNGGASGAVLYSTIASYQSATQVTLANACANASNTTTATVYLTSSYYTTGAAGTGGSSFDTVGGIDLLFPFEVDINVNEVDVQVSMATASASGLCDIEVSGTT